MMLEISDTLAHAIADEAAARGMAVEVYLRTVLWREHTAAEREVIEREQTWWLGLPLNERARYEGQYVAVHGQQVVDSDHDDLVLFRRIRSRYGRTPVLMLPAEGPPEIKAFSPRIVS
jgi:hypothetical protein